MRGGCNARPAKQKARPFQAGLFFALTQRNAAQRNGAGPQTYFPSPEAAIVCSTYCANSACVCVLGWTVSANTYVWSAFATV